MAQSNNKRKKCQGVVGVYAGSDGESVFSGSMTCKKWSCPACAPKKLSQLRKRLLTGMMAQEPISKHGLKFVTLTFGGNDQRADYRIRSWESIYVNQGDFLAGPFEARTGPWETLKYWKYDKKFNKNRLVEGFVYDTARMYDDMMSGFNKLLTALKKKYGKFHYFRIHEPHQDGVPHLHVLFAGNAVIPKAFKDSIEKLWKKYGLGFVKVNTVRDKNGRVITLFNDVQHAINYMLKYLTKDVKTAGKWKRVFSSSRNSLFPIQKKEFRIMKIIMGTFDDKGSVVEKIVFNDQVENDHTQVTFAPGGKWGMKKSSIEEMVINRHLSHMTNRKERKENEL